MATENAEPQSDKRKRLMATAKEYGLTREDRLALSEYLLRRDITSWTQLSESQVDRLLDAFEGFHLIGQLILDRNAVRL